MRIHIQFCLATDMLYYLVRPLATIALKIFLRKITITNMERAPSARPVILAVNHPTAFMEPCILACTLGRPLYFLVRGDVFAKPFYAAILKAFHMLPMYRLKDRGYKFVKENFQTLDACFDALHENKTIMILAEGTTIAEKRLRPIKKGTARLAFGALDKYPDMEEVHVVPVGVNFDYMDRFRAEVMIDFGHPIKARDYYEMYRANGSEGTDRFTEELAGRMRSLIVNVEKQSDDALAEQLLVMSRSLRRFTFLPVLGKDPALLQQEQLVANYINTLAPTEKSALTGACGQYFEALQKGGVSDRAVAEGKNDSLSEKLLLLAGLPVFLAGFVFNFLPARLARYIADKQIESVEFYAPVMLVLAMAAYLLYYAGWGLFLGWKGLWLLPLAALAGYFSVLYREAFQLWKYRRRWAALPEDRQRSLHALRADCSLNV
ncbi:MAG TPA: 1-acyl-sn-glycerol-3-phosphate acyltransferase [Saprospiraceae bacterium]|nr:1-acyl-sn-glycerol-3-phosphate acyltransferase [Saprospiraceae bacterium]